MPSDDTWPPKPALPDPLTEYDDVIAAKLAALSETKTGPNKIQLIKALRDEEGMDLSRAYAIVSNYWERHTDLARTQAVPVLAWLGCLAPLFALGLALFNGYLGIVCREAVVSKPHHHAALMALDRQQMEVFAAMALLVAVSYSTTLLRSSRRKK